jgi:hypothetical protein
MTEEEGKVSNNSSSSTSSKTAPGKSLFESPEINEEDGLDSNNPTASIHQWSWSMSQTNIPMAITSPSLDSDGLTPSSEIPPVVPSGPPYSGTPPKARLLPRVKSGVYVHELIDVVSFPALPRKPTADWYSPLPDNSAFDPHISSTLFHDAEIDASRATVSHPTKNQDTQWSHHASEGTSPSLEQTNAKQETLRKSVVKAHPNALPRVGSASSSGSSLGISSGERMKTSKFSAKHVKTIDDEQKRERAGAHCVLP